VWTSGAQFADWGYLLARTDPDVPKHRGLTAFLVPMRAAGVEVRPLRQMTGGSSFNEVFFDALRVNDDLRLGGVGDGWRVAMTTLGFERVATGDSEHIAFWRRVRMLAERLGAARDPVVRQRLARLYTTFMLLDWTNHRADAALRSAQTPGPEGSIRKLAWSRSLLEASEVVSMLLGPRLVADSGEWGMFAWSEFVTGAPGSRIAGGSDEVQRNIMGERVLGLASDERVDRDVPFSLLVQEAP
jgi:alkylation response protein AidB-like acyl-CoA dehydrogenase